MHSDMLRPAGAAARIVARSRTTRQSIPRIIAFLAPRRLLRTQSYEKYPALIAVDPITYNFDPPVPVGSRHASTGPEPRKSAVRRQQNQTFVPLKRQFFSSIP